MECGRIPDSLASAYPRRDQYRFHRRLDNPSMAIKSKTRMTVLSWVLSTRRTESRKEANRERKKIHNIRRNSSPGPHGGVLCPSPFPTTVTGSRIPLKKLL